MKINTLSVDESGMSVEKLHYIESILTTDKILDNIKEATVEAVVANRWYGNFLGLMTNELQIPPIAFYIHLRINGYNSSLDYKGGLSVKILDEEVFEEIEDTYLRHTAYRKSLGE